jgi:hypothetical protein
VLRRLTAYLIVLALVFAGYQRGGFYLPGLPTPTEEEEQKQQQSEEESAEGLRLKVEASSDRHHRTHYLLGPSAVAADLPVIVAIFPPLHPHPTLLVRRQPRLQC